MENAVGTLRREFLVPVPEFVSITEENKLLLEKCTSKLEENHYKHGVPIKDLFADDVKNLLVLNPHEFDTARYTIARTDKYGKLVLDAKYTYSASPAVHSMSVQLKITSSEVIIYDNDMHEIVRHQRLYGEKAESMSWIPYLKFIARKPRSLFNSGVYEMMPTDMQNFMKACDNGQRGKVLKMLADLTDRSGFESALNTIHAGIRYNATDPDSLMMLYRRMYSKVPLLPQINTAGTPIPSMPHIANNTDLTLLDQAVREGGQKNHD